MRKRSSNIKMTKAAVSRETSKIAGGWRWGPGKLVGGGSEKQLGKRKIVYRNARRISPAAF